MEDKKITLEINDFVHRQNILIFFAKNGRIISTGSSDIFTLYTKNKQTVGVKTIFKALKIPEEGNFILEYKDNRIELEITPNVSSDESLIQALYERFGMTSDTIFIFKHFKLIFLEKDSEKILKLIEDSINFDNKEQKTENLEIYYNKRPDAWEDLLVDINLYKNI